MNKKSKDSKKKTSSKGKNEKKGFCKKLRNIFSYKDQSSFSQFEKLFNDVFHLLLVPVLVYLFLLIGGTLLIFSLGLFEQYYVAVSTLATVLFIGLLVINQQKYDREVLAWAVIVLVTFFLLVPLIANTITMVLT